MKRFYFLVILICIGLFYLNAQGKRWKMERNTIVLGTGITHFLGDLGGGAKDAAHFFGIRDIDLIKTRPVISAKYRYRILENLALKSGLSWGIIAASDEASKSEGRRMRNLSFSSNIWEFSFQGEYYFFKEKESARYSFTSLTSIENFSAYVFTGFTAVYFNPKAELNGEKHALQPLGTEGQGIGDNPAPYSRIAYGIPIGIGAKYNLTKKLAVGIEISNTYTSSDYLDDVHDAYFDNDLIRAKHGDIAAALADRHLSIDGGVTQPYESGTRLRGGSKYNDAYIMTVVTLTYKIRKRLYGLPKY
ncbi:MAG: hypothetical protein B6I20_09530 [Bacteroidetes bacterium 4572_117]|nr:MAG: hypothetical protein B6I20_09530 [Bacteroidetes bacterium 4572_117]